MLLTGRPFRMIGRRPWAFSLIELLVVVAILAILAAIAVPNLQEMQARGKVSRELADLRTLAVALEAYSADHNSYPLHGAIPVSGLPQWPATVAGITTVEFTPGLTLTTPQAYLTSLPLDPCLPPKPDEAHQFYGYVQTRQMAALLRAAGRIASAEGIAPRYGGWRLYAAGPDGDKGRDTKLSILYDPTNGTVSDGDLLRSQNQPLERLSVDEQ